MKKALSITIYLREDDSFYARVEELKNCFAYGDTIAVLLFRLQEAIKLALSVEDPEG